MFDHEQHQEITRRFESLERKIQRIESRQDDMEAAEQAAIDQLTTELGVQHTAIEQVATDATASQKTLQAEFDSLAAANPGLDLSGLQAAVAANGAAIAPLDPAVKALGEIKPTPATPEALPLYTHTGEDAIDPAYTLASVETAPTDGSPAEALYTFNGDTAGGAPAGAVEGVWTVYTAASQAVPATQ